MQITLYDHSRRRGHHATLINTGKVFGLKFPYNPNLLADIRGFEGARWNPDEKIWTFKDPSQSLRNQFLLGYLTNGELYPEKLKQYFRKQEPVGATRNLHDYQQEDLTKLYRLKRVMLAAEMGLGKTLIGIELLELVCSEHPDISPENLAWVIGPNSAISAWKSELKKWKSRVRPRLLTSHVNSIMRAMKDASYPPRILIIDESADFKTPSAKRTQVIFELNNLMAKYWKGEEYMILLCGAPAPKDPCDWWSQVEIARPGWLRENSQAKFRKRLAELEEMEGPHGKYLKVTGWKMDEVELLHKRLQGAVIVRFKKDCLSLPEKVYDVVNIEPSKEFVRLASLIKATTSKAIVTLAKHRQLSDGFQYDKVEAEDWAEDNQVYDTLTNILPVNPKLDWLAEKLEEFDLNGKDRLVVYAAYKGAIDAIVARCVELGWHVIRVDGRGWHSFGPTGEPLLEASQESFQSDNGKKIVFVGNPKAAGKGLTLTKSDTMVFFSNTFNADDRIQAEDRIHRIGMKGALIIDLIHLPTDQLVLDNIKNKRNLQKITMEEIDKCTS